MECNLINEYIHKCHEAAKKEYNWASLPSDICPHCKEGKEGTSCTCEDFIARRNAWIADKIDDIAGCGYKASLAARDGKFCTISNSPVTRGNYMPDTSKFNEGIRFQLFQEQVKGHFPDEITNIFIQTCDLMGFYNCPLFEGSFRSLEDCKQGTTEEIVRGIRFLAINFSTNEFENRTEDEMSYAILMSQVFTDILVGCVAIAELEDFDLEWHINAKLAYNSCPQWMTPTMNF